MEHSKMSSYGQKEGLRLCTSFTLWAKIGILLQIQFHPIVFSNNYTTPSVEPVSININFEEEHGQQPVKSAYHSFYVYPRSQGNKINSPNLLWHEVKTQGWYSQCLL